MFIIHKPVLMFKKIINLLSSDKKEQTPQEKAPLPSDGEAPVTINYEKYLRVRDNYLHLTDSRGELGSLPDSLFEGHEQVEHLSIHVIKVEEFPAALKRFKNLKSINLGSPKLRQLPSFVFESEQLESLQVYCAQLRVDEHFLQLKQLKNFRQLHLSKYYGNKWPSVLKNLDQIKVLSIFIDEEKADHREIVQGIGEMKFLEEVRISGNLNLDQIGEDITALDHLNDIRCWFSPTSSGAARLNLGLLNHVRLNLHFGKDHPSFDDFRAAIREDDFDKKTRKILYAFFSKNFSALMEVMPNPMPKTPKEQPPVALYFEYKPSRDLSNRLKEQEACSLLRLATQPDADCFHVINVESSFEAILDLVRKGKTILLEDHVKEWLTAVEDPWLKQEKNQDANEQVYRLLASNQVENYLVAFQIIAGGGANDELVSMIAAIMLSHPDKKVAREAEKLFAKVGPTTTQQIIKQKKISLRRSGNSFRAINWLFQTEIGILSLPFRLMHNVIAGENPTIKDVEPGNLSFKDSRFNEPFPQCARFFEKFKSVDFSGSQGLDLDGALRHMAHWPALRKLDFSGCHYTIPARLADLRNLHHLDLTSNTLEDPGVLTGMTQLQHLSVEGCKITSWGWLSGLQRLHELNLARNELKKMPVEVFSLTSIQTLSLKQNKLKAIDPGLFSLRTLSELDLSNNQVSELDYQLFSALPLQKLYLRSNKISLFEPEKIMEMTGGKGCFALQDFNIGGNRLKEFRVLQNLFPRLTQLDISKNEISELDGGIFQYTRVDHLFASENRIANIPASIAGKFLYKLFLQKNQIAELPDHFSTATINNCDLRSNRITSIPDSFKRKSPQDFSRLYWKWANNPLGNVRL